MVCPVTGLAVSIRGCIMKNSQRKSRSCQIIRSYFTHKHIVGYAQQLLFHEIFCKGHGLARRSFLASGGQPEVGFFQTYVKSIHRSWYSTVPNFIEMGSNGLDKEYLRGKYHCTVDLLFNWFGISCVTTDNFCFHL
jgi:hypothetical protein